MLREIVCKHLAEHANIPADKLSDPTLKMSELGLDSLGLVELLFAVEDRYGVHIQDTDSLHDMTLSEIIAHLEKMVQDKGDADPLALEDIAKAA
jgi:acyl carrier protein